MLDGRREITEEDLKKIEERYKVVERLKNELKFDEEETESQSQPEPKPQPAKPEKPKSLRDEAIELAKKLGDKELAKYLENAPLKTIQRRIQALREDVEKMGKKSTLKKESTQRKR